MRVTIEKLVEARPGCAAKYLIIVDDLYAMYVDNPDTPIVDLELTHHIEHCTAGTSPSRS